MVMWNITIFSIDKEIPCLNSSGKKRKLWQTAKAVRLIKPARPMTVEGLDFPSVSQTYLKEGNQWKRAEVRGNDARPW